MLKTTLNFNLKLIRFDIYTFRPVNVNDECSFIHLCRISFIKKTVRNCIIRLAIKIGTSTFFSIKDIFVYMYTNMCLYHFKINLIVPIQILIQKSS